MTNKQLVLIVDDVNDNIQVVANFIRGENLRIAAAMTGGEAIALLEKDQPDVMLLDLGLPDMNGQEVLEVAREKHPNVQVVVVSATNDPEVIVHCMKNGALDYLVKPIEKTRALTAVRNALNQHRLERENNYFRQHIFDKKLSHPEAFADIVTVSDQMREAFCLIEMIAETPFPVLVTGETGTGKELVAKAIHQLSGRQGPFLPVNLAGLDDSVVADALFGHVKGAFTGANSTRDGALKKADDGTVFLDEIGDASAANQVKLLRVLENREYTPMGSDEPLTTNARVVMATNQDLKARVDQGEFRSDVYFRLNQFHVHIPPLRERLEDLEPLLEHFIRMTGRQLGKPNITCDDDVVNVLRSYPFPGNVRELRNVVSAAVATCGGDEITSEAAGNLIQNDAPTAARVDTPFDKTVEELSELPTLKEAGDALINEAMRRANDNQGVAAEMLGLSRTALCKRLKRK